MEGDLVHVRIDNMDIMSILVLWKYLNVECDDGDNFFISSTHPKIFFGGSYD